MELSNATEANNALAIIRQVQTLAKSPVGDTRHVEHETKVLNAMGTGDLELQGLMPWSSNYTFLATLTQPDNQEKMLAVYKPCAGERPLWDFPNGNLCEREFVSYLMSQALGWPKVPPTLLRDGPHGPGSVQLFIEAEFEAHYFNMRESLAFTPQLREIALFDYIINNADRKGGHCLKDQNGQLWAIDHGLTFHPDFKLRTVIWDFCKEPISATLLDDLGRIQRLMADSEEFVKILRHYLTWREIKALQKRIDALLTAGSFPDLHPGRNVPYPPI